MNKSIPIVLVQLHRYKEAKCYMKYCIVEQYPNENISKKIFLFIFSWVAPILGGLNQYFCLLCMNVYTHVMFLYIGTLRAFRKVTFLLKKMDSFIEIALA